TVHIGGFQKNSLIDFPGTIACVVFTMGCNFKCPYCHNPALASGPVTGAGQIDLDDIFSFLSARKGLVDGVVITGGEPCLQPGLVPFITRIKELDTNGSRPDLLAQLLDRSLVDYLAMDIKTGPDLYPGIMKPGLSIEAIHESMDIIMAKAPAYEFRTTCVRPFIDTGIMKEIAQRITGAQRYVLQNCSRDVQMLDPHFSQQPDRFFSDKEIRNFQSIAAKTVQEVLIR
ncbi:MAG: anaerobic ribonucleoside-triphosphate reductase activating protein, partial [Desulfotignum sp.]